MGRGARCPAPCPRCCCVVGLLLLAEVAVTLVWQEPLSALSARGEQSELSERLREAESAALAAPTGFAAGKGNGRGARARTPLQASARRPASRSAGSRSGAWA